ncbi:type II toxin-antitoxin system death-on-curing family toxin [Hyphomicrobium sp.]|uniref:type II toxin-antitoxin system death-on-curing family toxin n=1 Tax=Hyphomicrobium sp. TaxID=82 RepID=UPI000FA6BC8E|nr:type II toxin-antitoxin system death-on-curing family toxin [Hyphomicrobium sp.]RUO98598.1 MAG: type II toxin-antitoxin system death-on-curing family toxin [Hyphomicrobium sp.]
MKRRFLAVEEVLALHRDVLDRNESDAVLNRGSLESAVARPAAYHRGLLRQAAVLFHAMIQNHPFLSGNKRTAFNALNVFLNLNKVEIWVTSNTVYYWLMDALEHRTFSERVIESWLRSVTRRHRP